MAAKGYCTAADVAAFLDKTFTAGQTTQANNLIEPAEVYIDGETNRGWLVGVQTDERFYCPGYELFLQFVPVTSVDTITGRAGLGEGEDVLVADEDYEVRDLGNGYIMLLFPGSYDRVQVDYTPVNTVPADIEQACIEMVASWMLPVLQSDSFGLDSYSLPDLTVKFSRSHVQAAIPPVAAATLERYHFGVHA
jgi:hypothetical protein